MYFFPYALKSQADNFNDSIFFRLLSAHMSGSLLKTEKQKPSHLSVFNFFNTLRY
ncbi:Uncharacterized protein dnm_014980 [Desulfonema magnum]|uniref:Uncharacterized protein n=1 Tax=Desulfonema magnum TaxID=45655 RepID=A0A975BHG3_9BACT|nr:Uncharacterized protein dnm_014980 [Desulfonema magnum]